MENVMLHISEQASIVLLHTKFELKIRNEINPLYLLIFIITKKKIDFY